MICKLNYRTKMCTCGGQIEKEDGEVTCQKSGEVIMEY